MSSRKAHERVSPAKALQPAVAVPRVDGRSMSAEQFARDFAQPRRPVVLTGLAHAMVESADGLWTPELLTAVAGDCQVPLRRMACGSRNWAGLEAGATASVAEYVEHVCGRRPQTRLDGHYLFDWSLPLHCPALAARLTIPQTFAGNYLPHTADGTCVWVQGGGGGPIQALVAAAPLITTITGFFKRAGRVSFWHPTVR